eukprot:CAMPEP_0180412282 /NCGR_PEP_ID=MMETSP0989-20121125/44455_1 /TAXON_ID=697907 /ORGANISM="non described non described, Strain CCMP2293" /LENGTH=34 /DNA_ID= /DNA_START= /DNA_END= /DNA_ORIENTATION=
MCWACGGGPACTFLNLRTVHPEGGPLTKFPNTSA